MSSNNNNTNRPRTRAVPNNDPNDSLNVIWNHDHTKILAEDDEINNAKEDSSNNNNNNNSRLVIDRDTQRDLISWRRDQVVKYWSRGHSITAIAKILKVAKSTVHSDLKWLLEQNRQNLQRHLDEGLPSYYFQSMSGLQHVLVESWTALLGLQNDEDAKTSDKTALLSLIKECYKSIAELSNSGTVVQQAIEFTKNANKKLDNYREPEPVAATDIDAVDASDIAPAGTLDTEEVNSTN